MELTGWDSLDWDNIDPTDKRYYLCLHLAMQERIYCMYPTAPLEGNTYPTYVGASPNGTLRQTLRQTDTVDLQDQSQHKAWTCQRLHQLLRALYGYFYAHTLGSYSRRNVYGYFPSLDDYTINGVNRFPEDFLNSADLADVAKYPADGYVVDNDYTVNWLKKMKLAIQQVKYIEINGCNFYSWLYKRNVVYAKVDGVWTYDLEDAIPMTVMVDKPYATAHDYLNDSAYVASEYLRGNSGGYNPYHDVIFEKRDIRWRNMLQYPVDVYGIAYQPSIYPYYGGTTRQYHDFGTGWTEGERRFLGTIQPGDEAGYFFEDVDWYNLGQALPVAGQTNGYCMAIKLVGEIGKYFNFKS